MSPGYRRIFRLTVAAVLPLSWGLASAAQAGADGERLLRLTRPGGTVEIGTGYLSSDGIRFGQYSGVREEGAYGLLNVDAARRFDASGTWLRLTGRNLGFDNRELRFEHRRQGSWGYHIDFSQTPRYEPFTVHTAVTGIGSPTPAIPFPSRPGEPHVLKTERSAVGFGVNRSFAGKLDLQLYFRNEEKDGARVFGRGTRPNLAGVFEFVPEPINSTTRQFGATLGYGGKRLQVSAGYYGTVYDNRYTALDVAGGSPVGGGNALNAYTPIALPPDNQSHQVFVTGGYNLTPTTRGTFKAAYTHATQNNVFAGVPLLTPGIGTSLRGRVGTLLLQGGVTARPLPKLSLLANIRYEDRDDRTPILDYNPLATGNYGYLGINQPFSMKTLNARLEASYALPAGLRLTGGLDFDQRRREYGIPIVVRHRPRTDERSYRVELRRSMSETLTGSISYIHSDRDGSGFMGTATPGYPDLVSPINLADRSRHRVRASITWTPMDPLTLQFAMSESRDDYRHPDAGRLGPQAGMSRDYALDATYTFSDAWQATLWYSRNETRLEQLSRTDPATAGGRLWAAALGNRSNSFGLSANGKPSHRLDVGSDVYYSDITDRYRQRALAGPAIASLPNISTELVNMRLYAKYALLKNAGLRLDYIHNRFRTDEWTWTGWTFSDGTRLSQNPNQVVHFIGISGYYSW
ncbi:MtrB/PioB family decaheme-associated outer membrane protein [Nitrosovibrio sp. Nv17]|uniref:MtrB/PioB family decaheme-associated outer membrane protein n=1 Tax=Nitrosovibrio sp. Nv17 TaxID=1855339 RepID=UPI000908981A|nr:MtrB/PioB family decaheme-associated outer membrane protein [Nitrosovibrio sp. Nv17]SFW16175.1 decaheme-associated outer membrane protein, MtrB/PioB family [Nitrosovibrio sp. Nv17]